MGGFFILLFLCGATIPTSYAGDNACENEKVSLNFSSATITSIGEFFINSPLITCLDFEGSSIASIAAGAFNGVPNLRYLNLARNRLSLDDILRFGGHPRLETLVLNNLPDPYAENLNIWGEYPNMHNFHAKNKYISDIRSSDYTMGMKDVFPQLLVLDLSGNEMTSSDVFNSLPETLTHLYLHKNRITYISLPDLPHLLELTLNNNNIESVDNSFGHMESLQHLSLHHNQISEINFSFVNMSELLTLDLSSNKIKTVSMKTFESLTKLRNLSLDDNYLTEIPVIQSASNLTTLSLRCNKLKCIQAGVFHSMPLLEQLVLSYNNIGYIDSYAFAGLKNLRRLSLHNNALSHMPGEWIVPLKSLRYLDLSENNFTTLEALSLCDDSPLEQLHLQNNTLMSLKGNSFVALPENVTIFLRDAVKPLFDSSCNCDYSYYY